MVHVIIASIFGTTLGFISGLGTLLFFGHTGGGFETLVTLGSTALAGSTFAAPLGVTTGVTGGIIGGTIGVIFILLPLPAWLFVGFPLPVFVAKLVVGGALAGAASSLVAILFPH